MFVTIEGIEGSGKSTLLSGLADSLRARGREVFVTREPGGTPLGDAVRRIFLLEPDLAIDPLTEALLINAARAQHVIEAIQPALAAGKIVLCDRYADSTLAYQGFGRGVDLALLHGIIAAATGGLMPERTYVIDVPVDLSRARLADRQANPDRVEASADAFYDRTRAGYLHLAASSSRYHLIDGTLAADAVLKNALDDLLERVSR